jgi:hypothetical protein
VRTPVVITVVTRQISRTRAHVVERDHPREEGGTEDHHIRRRKRDIRPYIVGAVSLGVKARERESYRLLFLSVGILLGSLQTVEVIGHSFVLYGDDTLSKELRECCILATGECTSQRNMRNVDGKYCRAEGGDLLDTSICQLSIVGAGLVNGNHLTWGTALSVHEYSALTRI